MAVGTYCLKFCNAMNAAFLLNYSFQPINYNKNRSTGTIRPFGLDCSGFVTWSFINWGYTAAQIGHGAATKGTYMFLYCCGVMPVDFLNVLMKFEQSLNPQE